MNKKLIFVYETDGLSNARTKISRKQTDEIKTDTFEYLSLDKFANTSFQNPDFIILEDEAQNQIELIEATFEIDELSTILICDSLSTMEGITDIISQAPKIITLDYKIGDNNSPGNLPNIYKKLKQKFTISAIIGYTNFGRKKSDKEFSAKSADELTDLLRANGDAVIEKYGMTRTALSSILFDRMQVANLKAENNEIKAANKLINSYLVRAAVSLPDSSGKEYIVGKSIPMRIIYSELQKLKGSIIRVLITGENGTGKGEVAKAIYEDSPRHDENLGFCRRTCSAFPSDEMLLSELFGHYKGSYTGADSDRDGIFTQYKNGTIFLDEIGLLSLSAQATLLGVLQDKRFTKIGYDKKNPKHEILTTNSRVIFATNENLEDNIRQGKFRQDLYYRICEKRIELPPLRERKEDIGLLATSILNQDKTKEEVFDKGGKMLEFTITPEAIEKLMEFNYPGNVRQLEIILKNAMLEVKNNNIGQKKYSISDYHIVLPLSDIPIMQSSSKNADCSEAEKFLDEIETLLITNPKYINMSSINLAEISSDFGGAGLSRNSFYEKRVTFTPCIEYLMQTQPKRWKAIRAKKIKLISKPNHKK